MEPGLQTKRSGGRSFAQITREWTIGCVARCSRVREPSSGQPCPNQYASRWRARAHRRILPSERHRSRACLDIELDRNGDAGEGTDDTAASASSKGNQYENCPNSSEYNFNSPVEDEAKSLVTGVGSANSLDLPSTRKVNLPGMLQSISTLTLRPTTICWPVASSSLRSSV